MEHILEFLPTEIKTSAIVVFLFAAWRVYLFIKKRRVEAAVEKRELEAEIVLKVQKKEKFESRLKDVEEEVDILKKAFKERNDEVREDFRILSGKIDRVLEILINVKKG